jgi:hypothetical protein
MTVPIPVTPSHVSVNRVRIAELPGLALDPEVRGQQAYHLLSVLAVIRYAREQAAALALPPAFMADSPETRRELPCYVDACLASADPAQREAAEAIARRLGRNLAFVLITLHRGDAVNQAARPDWTPADWVRWAEIERVWLAGGLMSGRLGELLCAAAQATLADYGYARRPAVALSPGLRTTALLGAARYFKPGNYDAVVLDCGHTAVKRACVQIRGERISRVRQFAALPVAGNWHTAPEPDRARVRQMLLAFIGETVAQTRAEAEREGLAPGDQVMLAVAAYVDGGRLLGNGLYATLNGASDDARPALAAAMAEQSGSAARVRLIHDGTAAAAVHAGETHAAVISIGTALGIGFPPASAVGLLALPWRA